MTRTALDIDRLALRRAKAKLGWFSHATVFACVNLGLITLSALNGETWAIFPLLGWGVGLAAHGISVWALAPGGNLLDRLVQRERAKLSGAEPDLW